ncbi:MAG: molybdate ABC transporter permease subunit [Actinobacteria bacterium]|nr:molybdate ABC transporter permease subunit [Actinomycetota bacterium]
MRHHSHRKRTHDDHIHEEYTPMAACKMHRLIGVVFATLVSLCILPHMALAAEALSENPTPHISKDASAITVDGVSFGIDGFSRANKGTNKLYSGSYYGYRYPMASKDAFAVMVCDGYAVVYIPESVASAAGLDVTDADDREAFWQMLVAIDDAASNGGEVIGAMDLERHFTSEPTYTVGDYTYDFAVEVEEGSYYASATLAWSEDGSSGVLFCETGLLAPTDSIVIVASATGFDKVKEFFTGIDYRPFWVSLRTAGVAMIFVFVLGLLAAWVSLKVSDRLKGILDSIFTIPMVLPPTVCGFLLLVTFGQSTAFGRWLIGHGIELVFSWPAAVVAAIVVAFPLMYRTARGAFEALDPAMTDAARTLGWSEKRIFLQLMVPLGWPSIAAGTVLAFARAMGEFGATLFVAGNYAGVTQTMPIAIYFQWMGGNSPVAIFWVCVVILISFVVILFINIYSSRTQKYRLGGSVESDS